MPPKHPLVGRDKSACVKEERDKSVQKREKELVVKLISPVLCCMRLTPWALQDSTSVCVCVRMRESACVCESACDTHLL